MSEHHPEEPEPANENSQVVLVLNPAQVDHVVRAATGDSGVGGTLFAHLGGLGKRVAELLADPANEQRLSRSTLVALGILASFTPAGWERGVGEIAAEAGIRPSTAHRYISTLLAAGLLEQNPRTREYRLVSAGA